jgi:hypothetical protein
MKDTVGAMCFPCWCQVNWDINRDTPQGRLSELCQRVNDLQVRALPETPSLSLSVLSITSPVSL